MKYPEFTVSAVIFNPENKILLCRSHKWNDKYVIPGGHVEYGEKMEDALVREILEETGLSVYDIRPAGLKECFYCSDYYSDRHFIFMDYTCRTDSSEVVLNDEAQEYIWVNPENISDYPLGGFTETLLNKLTGHDAEDRENIYYNY